MLEMTQEILLVEDNPNDVELTLLAFQENRIAKNIHVVRDGAEALEFIFGREPESGRDLVIRPKVILLDLKLPKLDGWEVLQRLKSDPRTRSIPVVVLTTSREEPDIARCYLLGANSYIVKPVDFTLFSEVARELSYYWLSLNQAPVP
jgi:two-component system response regulator